MSNIFCHNCTNYQCYKKVRHMLYVLLLYIARAIICWLILYQVIRKHKSNCLIYSTKRIYSASYGKKTLYSCETQWVIQRGKDIAHLGHSGHRILFILSAHRASHIWARGLYVRILTTTEVTSFSHTEANHLCNWFALAHILSGSLLFFHQTYSFWHVHKL